MDKTFSKKLASQNVPVLGMPLHGRKAPKLDLAYSEDDLKLEQYHKNLTTLKILLKMFLQP